LQQEISTAKSDIDSVILQQKITDKKISNMIKSQEDVKDELEKVKARREALLLEMVDIQQGKYTFLPRFESASSVLHYFSLNRIYSYFILMFAEVEERKKKKISQWDAIKRACLKYKVHLDIHINLQEDKNCQFIKISFFTNNEDAKNKYFVQLSYSDNHWTGMLTF